MRARGAGGLVAPRLEFRLDAGRRRHATERALRDDRGVTVRDLGAQLQAGEAMAILLVEHVWAHALEDAVARTGGARVASRFVEATSLPLQGRWHALAKVHDLRHTFRHPHGCERPGVATHVAGGACAAATQCYYLVVPSNTE